jgi:predicted deacetylase
MDNIKSYKGVEIALHGLYHEKNRKRQLDDFHTRSKAAAEEEIRAGLEIFQEVGIKSYVFIPPAWKLNDNSIKVLEKLGFRLAEIQKKFILISQREEFKKIAIPEVLNWDSYGYPHKNIVNIKRNARRFEFLIKKKKSKIIRIALHPRDPFQALHEQIEIVCQLIDQGYKLIRYRELIPILLLERKKV